MSVIADAKAAVDIVEFARDYISLKRSGGDWWGCCPIHADRTPSFKINPARQAFYCFGCGAKGDVIDLLAAIEGLDISAALRRLQALAGGASPNPDAAAARAARRAALHAQEAIDAARRRAFAAEILGQSEPLTMGSRVVAGALSDRASRHHAMAAESAALAPSVPVGPQEAWAASSCPCRMPRAT